MRQEAIIAITLIITTVLTAGLWVRSNKETEWKAFTIRHACKIIDRPAGSEYMGGKTPWQCNNGITYWRDQ